MKAPMTEPNKFSLPGIMKVIPNAKGLPVVYPAGDGSQAVANNMLQVVYDHRPCVEKWDDFDTIRKRLNERWTNSPKTHDPISQEMRELTIKTREEQLERNAQSIAKSEAEQQGN